jgi:hypothetical protein
MAKVLPSIEPDCREFIARQRIFFAAYAAPGARQPVAARH